MARDGERDAARLRELEAELAEAWRAAEGRARLIGHVAHEFRTPLSSIIGFASLLDAEHRTLPEELRAEYLAIVLRNARHLLHVVNDILNLSKADAGTLEVTLAPLPAGEVASAVATSLQPTAAERGIRLSVHDRARHLAVADAGRLRQVLLNLLDNAIKYSPPGSPVEVRVTSEGGEVRVEVADRGPGLRPEDVALLFKEFSRISHGMRVAGAGLGLALAKQLTEAMGGRIGVDSEPGAGSVFWVALPADGKLVPRADAAAGPAGAAPARRRGVVAVVDDDPDIRRLLEVVLSGAGYQAVADDGGPGCAARLAEARPGAVLLDLNLDRRHGMQVLEEIRARPELARVPVAAFTAAAGDEEEAAARAAGFDDYLVKPIEPETLLARVDALLAGAESREIVSEDAAERDRPAAESADEAGEDDDFLAPLRARFRGGLRQRLASMRAAAAGEDAAGLQREVHKLRGTSAGYGFAALSELAGEVEEVLRAGAPASHPLVERLFWALEEMGSSPGD